jgi:hypothetical protein
MSSNESAAVDADVVNFRNSIGEFGNWKRCFVFRWWKAKQGDAQFLFLQPSVFHSSEYLFLPGQKFLKFRLHLTDDPAKNFVRIISEEFRKPYF